MSVFCTVFILFGRTKWLTWLEWKWSHSCYWNAENKQSLVLIKFEYFFFFHFIVNPAGLDYITSLADQKHIIWCWPKHACVIMLSSVAAKKLWIIQTNCMNKNSRYIDTHRSETENKKKKLTTKFTWMDKDNVTCTKQTTTRKTL